MKICFIWARSFRSFKNLNLNVGSSDKYHFDYASGVLEKTPLHPLPENFFAESITDVMAIVGINGSGKSNALELLCKIIKGPRNTIGTEYLIVFEFEGKLFCRHSLADGSSVIADFDLDIGPISEKIGPLKVIYFSNVFDEREHEFDNDVTDISLNKVYNMRNRYPRRLTGQFQKQIKFVADEALFEKLEVPPPVRLKISMRNYFFNPISSRFTEYVDSPEFQLLNKSLKRMARESARTNFLILMCMGVLLDVVASYRRRHHAESNPRNDALNEINTIFSKASQVEHPGEVIDQILNYLEEVSEHEHFPLPLDRRFRGEEELSKSWIEKRTDFIRTIPRWLNEDDIERLSLGNVTRSHFSVIFRIADRSKFSTFASLFDEEQGFDIEWLGVSSGQKAYINVFASIAHELKKYQKNKSNILIVIDEGDLYLHPQWQMDFFDKLNIIISTLSAAGSKIQLILTSHSPFILSDLPKQNIAMLEPPAPFDNARGYQLHRQTFAGNLYDLFYGPLFLRSPAISNFAMKKIEEVRDAIRSNPEMSENQLKFYLNFSNLIGHDLVRTSLIAEIENIKGKAGART